MKKISASILLLFSCYMQAANNPEIIRPVATHGMAMVFGYVTPEQYAGSKEIEPLSLNPFTGHLENSGIVTRLADLFNQNKAYILTNSALFRAMIKKYPKVRLENWRCKAISDFVYLFVQATLLPPENLQNPPADIPAIEAIEPYLGVKISNKVTISTDELRSIYYFKQPSKNLTEECTNILNCFWDGTQSKLFFTKTDYAKDSYQKMTPPPIIPAWGFLLLGFGKQSQSLNNPDGLACGLQIPQLRQLFDFFSSQINTGILIAYSSYFADINMVATLKETTKPELKKYPFSFISASIVAAPLLSGIGLEESYDYNGFFTKLLPPPTKESWRVNWQPNPKDFETVITMACRPYRYLVGAEERFTTPAAIPIFRPINNQFFIPARFGGSVVVITDSLIKPGLEKQPLYTTELIIDAPKKSYQSPDILLLSLSKNFTRPLVLSQRADKKLPTILGINPGPSAYIFDEIDARGARISDVIDALIRVPGLDQEQAFVIKKLHAINDLDKLVPVNRPQPEKTYFDLKLVHKRPIQVGAEGENMVVIRQFDCTKNCAVPIASVTNQIIEKQVGQQPSQQTPQSVNNPKYTVVAATAGNRQESVDIKWGAITPTDTLGPIDTVIAGIQSQQLPTTLGLFAL